MHVSQASVDWGRLAPWRTLVLLLLLAAPALGAELKFPQLTGRVVDEAGVLSPSANVELTDMLAQHEQATGEQVVVVTLPSLQGYSIEDFGYQLGRHWGIGQKGMNSGALLIVAPKEHKVRVEVGYGLEGKLTDAVSRIIIERDIVPDFRRGDFNAGVLAGTASILKVLSGDTGANAPASTQSGPQQVGDSAGVGLLVFAFFVLWFFLWIHFVRRSFQGESNVIRHSGRRSGGFGGGGLSGGGGFSGGGGSFGGGGASGSW
jgi:uncharacterized protein